MSSIVKPAFETTYCSIDRAKAKPRPYGLVLPLLDRSTGTLSNLAAQVTRLHPKNTAQTAHQHEAEEIVIVKSGLLEAEVNGIVHTLSVGDMIVIASNDRHEIRNTGNVIAEYYVIVVNGPATVHHL